MFDDLFHLVESLDHDYKDEHGKRVHAIGSRWCALSLGLSALKAQIVQTLRNIEFALGDSDDKIAGLD